MTVLKGSDGKAQLNLGDGLKSVANIFSWRAQRRIEMLRRTTQADETERRTAGIADWSGSFSFRLQFSDDTTTALSAWQILNFALMNTDDNLKASVNLILQAYQISPDYDIFNTTVSGIIKLTGTVVVSDVSLDCSDPEQPIVAVASWEGDDALILERT